MFSGLVNLDPEQLQVVALLAIAAYFTWELLLSILRMALLYGRMRREQPHG